MGIDDWLDYVENLEAKINHIEDTMVDIRNVIIKLTTQNNNIVIFLKELEKDLFPPEEDFNHPFNDVVKIENDEEAKKIYPDGWETVKPYLRKVPDPKK